MSDSEQSSIYDAYYYAHGCGIPYERNEHWMKFFGGIADAIVRRIQPKTVLDVGCAWGFLVEALRQRGVEAYGIDISEYAISQVHPSIKPYCWVGSAAEPFPQKYDLIINIEVLEHMPHDLAEKAVENFVQHAEDILFSSTPFDYKEITHINVQPPEYWGELFAQHGYIRDVEFDATFLTPWAVRFRRNSDPLPRLIRSYERRFTLLVKESSDLRQLTQEMRAESTALEGRLVVAEESLSQHQAQLELTQRRLDEQQSYVGELVQAAASPPLAKNPLGRRIQFIGRAAADAWGALTHRTIHPRLIPIHQLAPIQADPYNWKATDLDPQFLLAGPAPRGWMEFRATLASKYLGRATLYVDHGHGFQETPYSAIGQLEIDPKEFQAYIPFGLTARAIRLDPSDRPGPVHVSQVSLRRVSRPEILLRYFTGYLRRLRSRKDGVQTSAQVFREAWQEGKLRGIWRMMMARLNPPAQVDLYPLWLREHTLTEAVRQQMRAEVEAMGLRPRFSILMPVYNTDERWLRAAIDSVLDQVYPDWELCIADDASTLPYVRPILEAYAAQDSRVKIVWREQNGHISAASNSALEMASGEYVATLDHDDQLTPDALYHMALWINAHPEADMLYSDEDKITEDNLRHAPYFKPDWSPDFFLTQMYTAHFAVYRRSLVQAVGGYRPGFEGAQDYDLVLRLTENTSRIVHVPTVLYSWREAAGSTAKASDFKDYAYQAAQKALEEAIQRRGRPARVEPVPGYPGQFQVRWELQGDPQVSIVICTKDRPDLLDTCLRSIFERTNYPNFEVIVVDNCSELPETQQLLESWRKREPERFRFDRLEIPFNFSTLNNHGARIARGEIVLLLNNDTEVITGDWLYEMAAQAQRPEVGVVGGMLLYPDDTIQHAGIILGIGGWAGHGHKTFPADTPGYGGRLLGPSNFAGITGACLMMRRDLYWQLGGLDENLAVACGDVELCIRALQSGHYNVLVPSARLYHYESASRGYEDTPEKLARFRKEVAYVYSRWPESMENDPFYNPNLTREREDFSIGISETD